MQITGTTGNDVIHGTDSADTIDGSNGNDKLYGGGGNDTITGGPGTDYLYGEDGDDTLVSKRGTGPDYFDGGSGTDKVIVDFAKSVSSLSVDLSNSSVLQYFGDGGSLVNVEQITITGGTAADHFVGGALADSLSGYDGDDVLEGRGGDDMISGGNGYDVAVFSGPASAYSVILQSDGTYKVSGGTDGTDTLSGIETLRFSDGDRPIAGYKGSAAYWGNVDGSATFVKGANVPDGLGADPGTGFTITGLTRADDGTWWAANEGQANSSDGTYTPSLVHLSADMTTKLGEISVGSKATRSLQGLVYNNGDLYVASLSERLVKVYNATTGAYERSITPSSGTSVNGLAFDTSLNAVIIGHEDGNALVKQVEWRDASTGALIKTLNLANAPDHLYFDSSEGSQGSLWYTYGSSGAGSVGYVVKVDIASGQQLGTYVLPNADAIEGIFIDGNQMWLANDAYYHNGNPPLNRILQYSITPEAYILDESKRSAGVTVDLAKNDQTLADGTHLVGVERLFFTGGAGADVVSGGDYNDVLVGGDGADKLSGRAGADRLVGAAGDDVLTGGGGNDGLEGGDGSDTAVYSGARASYTITGLSSSSVSISDGRTGSPDGTDTVSNVELYKFSDGTYTFAQLFQANQAPTAVTLSSQLASLAENSDVSGGIKVADISISDDGLGTNTLSLSGADANSFAIRDTSGGGHGLYYVGTSPDYETQASYAVTVNAQDSGVAGSSAVHQDYTLAISDVNESPSPPVAGLNLIGTAGDDTISGGAGNDKIDGAAGNDTLYGLGGNDTLTSGPGYDKLYGGDGDDMLITKRGTGPDYFDGGNGVDTVNIDLAKVATPLTLDLTNPSVLQNLGDGSSIINIERILIVGGTGGDHLTGGALADTLNGYSGDDVLTGGGGNDGLEGGDGSDTAVYSGARASYTITGLSSSSVSISDGRTGSPDGTDTVSNVELYKFSDGTYTFAQLFQANQAPTAVTLSSQLASLAENSDVSGGIKVADISISDDGLGTNTLSLSGADANSFAIRDTSGGGHGLYYVGTSPDYETQASYAVTVNAQDSGVAGSSAVHQDYTLAISDVNESPTAVTLSSQLASLAENSDVSGGIKVADISISDDGLGTNTLSLSGADANSFAIRDTSGGGHGLYYVGTSPDYETQASYAVTVNAQDSGVAGSSAVHQDYTLAISDVNESPSPPVAGLNLIGTAGDDTISGGAGNDKIDGAAGNDTLYGLGGNDTLTSGPGYDKLYGGDGDDMLITKRGTGPDYFDGGNGVDTVNIDLAKVATPLTLDLTNPSVLQNLGDGSSIINIERILIVGGTGGDHLTGGALADTLNGYSGDDVLTGGGGNDRLEGGLGNDTLTGGADADTFVYSASSWGNDRITDFQHAVDLVDLRGSGLTFNDLQIGQQGDDVIITTPDHASSILLQHVQIGQITSSDFLF